VWDVPSGTLLRLLRGHEYGNCGGLAFTPDGQRLASAYETEIKIWNVSKGQELLSLPHPQFGTRAVAPLTRELVTIAALHFTPQGDRLYAVVRDGTILYWDASRTSQQPTSPEFQK
jgi:WD40 repeat protein